ncbi:MAG: hypothetical protein IJT12_01295 [Paludibacteraceae bacterium]|nr:hypothetical protein [Paludibacteraceae bacterium]
MKLTSQYFSGGWNLWKSHVRDSSVVMALQFAAMIVAMILIAPGLALMSSHPKFGLWYTVLAALAVLFTIGLLYYYVPVCFLAMRRGQSVTKADLQVGYARALAVSVMMVWPSIVSQILNQASNLEIGLGWKFCIALMAIGISVFAIVWVYAVATMLPLLASDHPDESVWQLTRRCSQLTEGHKWQLFVVDLEILIGPIMVLWVLLMIFVIALVIPAALSGNAAALTSDSSEEMIRLMGSTFAERWGLFTGIGLLCLLVMLVLQFVFVPIQQFAHALFYEDLIAEQEGAIEDTEAEVMQTNHTEEAEKPLSE